MKAYDTERFCDDLFAIAQNKLANKLLAIDAEKNDGIVLTPPQMFVTDIYQQMINASVYFQMDFAEDDISSDTVLGLPGQTIIPVTNYALIVFQIANANDTQLREKIAHRYRRALLEIYHEAFLQQEITCVSRWRVMPLPLNQIFYEQANRKAVGVAIHGALALN